MDAGAHRTLQHPFYSGKRASFPTQFGEYHPEAPYRKGFLANRG